MESRVDFAWGLGGLTALLPESDLVVIVDVLSFSTAVDVAVARGALVYPYAWGEEGAADFAEARSATLAQPRGAGVGQLSLSPGSLAGLDAGARVVLPSPNGSALSRETGSVITLAGCLRNGAYVDAAQLDSGTLAWAATPPP